MAHAQQKTSSTERAALGGHQSSMGHIDYRGLTDSEIRAVWISKFSDHNDHALHPQNLESIDRKWRRNRTFTLKPGGKY